MTTATNLDLAQVLTDARGEAALMRKRGYPQLALALEELASAVEKSAEDYLKFIPESQARIQGAKLAFLRRNYPMWEKERSREEDRRRAALPRHHAPARDASEYRTRGGAPRRASERSAERRLMATLLAGRDLDVAVAEQLMGWRRAPATNLPNRHWRISGPRRWRKPGSPLAHSLPTFSTGVAAAWLVVEEMARRGWVIDVQNRQLTRWACHVNFPAPDYRHVFEVEDTAPLAICRAAIVAVEGLP